jgi:phosphatidylglycerol:prolipoprotein diacylglycerol transferase
MLIYPHFDPVAIKIGPLAIHWYGIMYLLGFLAFYFLGKSRLAKAHLSQKDLDDLLFYGVLGVVLGGRLGYVFFYQPNHYLTHPLDILAVWQGGMSFHGGLLGVIVAVWIFARRKHIPFLILGDFIAPLVPPGLFFGRLGNFINGELWGRPTDLPWGMVFPHVDYVARHPSQLYEAFLEGVVLFLLLWFFSKKDRPQGAVSGFFLVGYGLIRFSVEWTREPDNFLGTLAFGLSMGQWLSLPMILAGLVLIILAYHTKPKGT